MSEFLPLVTIITPSYNQGEFIGDCMRSVMNQTYKKIEHIIIDNESTDQTDEVVKSYQGKYNMIYIREKDSGQANAINKGFKLSKGEIICWLNSDDFYFDDNCIEKVIEIFSQNSEVDVVTGNGYFSDRNGNLSRPIIVNPKRITEKRIKYVDDILQPSTFWKKNNLILNERYNYVFDWDFFIRFFENKLNFFVSNDYFSVYRMYENNKTGEDTAKRKFEVYLIQKKYQGKFDINIAWCYFVYLCYKMSEKLNLKFIKKLMYIINRIFYRIFMGRICSC